MANSDTNSTIIALKCIISIIGFFSLITPWLFYPNFYEMNFLGIIRYESENKFRIEPEFQLLILFGISYLAGLICSYGAYESQRKLNTYLGYLSLILIMVGFYGYFTFTIMIIAYTSIVENRDIIYIGIGFYLAFFTSLMVLIEFIYLKIKNSKQSKTDHINNIVATPIESNESILRCPNCNSEIKDSTSTFCNRCGSPLT